MGDVGKHASKVWISLVLVVPGDCQIDLPEILAYPNQTLLVGVLSQNVSNPFSSFVTKMLTTETNVESEAALHNRST